MKQKLLFFIFISLLSTSSIFLSGCEDRNELNPTYPVITGVDFTNFVTIGNSITAGYQSGSLYESAQEYSFGNLIAGQVRTTFVQPLYSDPGTPGRMEIQSISPGLVIKNNTISGSPLNLTYAKAYNNLGIPGATLFDVLNARDANSSLSGRNGSPNPMFDLVLRTKGTQFEQARSLNPTFITLWIGNNDVLGYATSGGVSPAAPTPKNTFAALYNQLIDSIASLGAKAAIATIPNVTAIPFFTTVGSMMAVQVPWTTLGVRDVWYQKSGEGVASSKVDSVGLLTGKVLLTLQAQAFSSQLGLPSGLYYRITNRPIPSGVDTTKPFGFHPQNPIPNPLVLDETEIAVANDHVASFNQTITAAATAKGFALVDMNTVFNNIRSRDFSGGTIVNGIKFTTAYVQGGLFSLDGVHPSSQGHGIIANEFIKAINAKYNSNIPLVNVATIPSSLILTSSPVIKELSITAEKLLF